MKFYRMSPKTEHDEQEPDAVCENREMLIRDELAFARD